MGTVMAWVEFADRDAFTTYHDAACVVAGIPKPGRNQRSAQTTLDAQWTVAWVRPVLDGGTIKANIPDADVRTYRLKRTSEPIDLPTRLTWDSEIDKALPETWEGEPVPSRSI